MADYGPIDPGHGAEAALLQRWHLTPDGDPVTTASSMLLPALTDHGTPVMVKLSHSEEEARGGLLMAAWGGVGAARVLATMDTALLLERATGHADLSAMVTAGADDAATRILCRAAARLHARSGDVLAVNPPPPLIGLERWFRELFVQADESVLNRRGAELARALLDSPQEEVVLHGDLHHGNVLDFGGRGWLAIDPKGLHGERAFEYCNLLCNPSHERALAPGRLERQFAVVTDAAGLEPVRFAQWLVAWCALSSTWFRIDEGPALAASAAEIGERALELLDGLGG